VITSDTEEDQEATPRVRNYNGKFSRPRAPVKEEEDEEDEQPTPSAARIREESIVPDSEEEEDEVNDLLAGDTENEDI